MMQDKDLQNKQMPGDEVEKKTTETKASKSDTIDVTLIENMMINGVFTEKGTVITIPKTDKKLYQGFIACEDCPQGCKDCL